MVYIMNTSLSILIKEFHEAEGFIDEFQKSGQIPRIELDIVLSKLQFIYDALYHLKDDTYTTLPSEATGEKISENFSPERKPPIARTVKDPIQEMSEASRLVADEPAQNLSTDVNTDLITLEEMPTSSELHPSEVSPEATSHIIHSHHQNEPEVHAEKEILAERYKKNQTYINELLAQGFHKKDVSSLMQSKSIRDIESAIGINEKFLFTKELFNGDSETYVKTIRILNNAANFNEAFNYIRQTFSWNLEGSAAQKLLDLVRRRFIVDED
jgi:hypothetical protein